jgi:hypothetical protein
MVQLPPCPQPLDRITSCQAHSPTQINSYRDPPAVDRETGRLTTTYQMAGVRQCRRTLGSRVDARTAHEWRNARARKTRLKMTQMTGSEIQRMPGHAACIIRCLHVRARAARKALNKARRLALARLGVKLTKRLNGSILKTNQEMAIVAIAGTSQNRYKYMARRSGRWQSVWRKVAAIPEGSATVIVTAETLVVITIGAGIGIEGMTGETVTGIVTGIASKNGGGIGTGMNLGRDRGMPTSHAILEDTLVDDYVFFSFSVPRCYRSPAFNRSSRLDVEST